MSWLSKGFKAVKKVVRPVTEVFEQVAKTLVLYNPLSVAIRGVGMLMMGPSSGQVARKQNEGRRDESMLTSDQFEQSRVPDEYSLRQGQAFERGQYSSNPTESRTMIGSNSQEEEMLGLMEEQRRRGTLLGE